MNNFLLLQKITDRLDAVPCKPRLFPARLYALQLLTSRPLDKEIDTSIIQPLMELTGYDSIKFHYKFIKETVFHERSRKIPQSHVEQFIIDLKVYGLREAISYFHTIKFKRNPEELIDSSIELYHDVAKLYLDKENELKKSEDERIKRLLLTIELCGEGLPQQIKIKK